jgi:peptide-methionine (S)-S-oxide reductase
VRTHLLIAATLSLACSQTPAKTGGSEAAASPPAGAAPSAAAEDPNAFAPLPPVPAGHEIATFATGCFWCTESDFEKLAGVKAVVSGYIGGEVDRPKYKQVGRGGTGHTEGVRIVFDPKVVTYAQLLDVFWHTHDPTTPDRQFCDRGDQYRPELFWHSEEQRKLAEESKARLAKDKPFPQPIVTKITKAVTFFPAENYHQDFHLKNPAHYQRYRIGCGRDARVKELWGDKAGGSAPKKAEKAKH